MLQCQSYSNSLYSKLIHHSSFLSFFPLALGKQLAQMITPWKILKFKKTYNSCLTWKYLSSLSEMQSPVCFSLLVTFPAALQSPFFHSSPFLCLLHQPLFRLPWYVVICCNQFQTKVSLHQVLGMSLDYLAVTFLPLLKGLRYKATGHSGKFTYCFKSSQF